MREGQNKIVYEEKDLQQVTPTPMLNLPDIVETECREPIDGSPYRVFYCEGTKPWRYRACRKCGSINIRSLGYTPEPRLVHDVNIGITQNDILLKVDRYQCNDCGESFSRQFEGVMENRQMTDRLYEQIKRDSFRLPFVEVAAQYGLSDTTIANIFDEYSAELESARGPITAPHALGIDEKHIVKKMRAIFVDLDTGELLEVKPNNKKDDIIGTIESMVDYDKNIKIVTMDMANGYKSYVETCLPYAIIIVDKYHVYQDLYAKIKKTRKRILEEIATQIAAVDDPVEKQHLRDVRDLVAKNHYLFKFSLKKLAKKDSRLAEMADVCKTFPEFNHLRLLKEKFELIYSQSTRAEAELIYSDWTELVPPTGSNQVKEWEATYGVKAELFKEFRVFRNAMKKWKNEVFNYFDANCEYTNAAAEGTNSMIQSMNSMGNGYSFDRLRARALFWHQAAPRLTYAFNKKSVEKKRPVLNTSFYVPSLSSHNYELEYETYYEDVDVLSCEEVDGVYKPTSVYAYARAEQKTNPEGFID